MLEGGGANEEPQADRGPGPQHIVRSPKPRTQESQAVDAQWQLPACQASSGGHHCRLAHELHREREQHANQLWSVCEPSIGGKQGVFLGLYGGVGRVVLEVRQGREAAIIDF